MTGFDGQPPARKEWDHVSRDGWLMRILILTATSVRVATGSHRRQRECSLITDLETVNESINYLSIDINIELKTKWRNYLRAKYLMWALKTIAKISNVPLLSNKRKCLDAKRPS